MITYSEFIRIRRAEEESNELTSLNDSTLEDMKMYIATAKKSLEEAKKINNEDKISAASTSIKNAMSTLDAILNIRLRKIMQYAILGIPLDSKTRDNMLSKEIELFDKLSSLVKGFKFDTLNEVREVKPAEDEVKHDEDDDSNKVVVKILSDIPKFVWKNNKTYGPYSFSNVVELDEEIADILVKSGKATLV